MSNDGNDRQRRKRVQSPESRFYDTLKGENVRIILQRDGIELTAKLLWVDRYTLGIEVNNCVERLISKSSLESIELRDHHAMRKRHDHSGAASR